MGMIRITVMAVPYFLCGMMDVMVGSLRGMGNSFVPMIVSIVGVCVFRVGWIYTVFASHRTLEVLYMSYPVSWTVTGLCHFVCFLFVKKKLTRRIQGELALERG